MLKYDIVIVGAGASGMMAAITAARANSKADIVLLERNSRVGKKLLTTGNGRCNISNVNIDISRFHSNNIKVVDDIISSFDKDYVEKFFLSIGIPFIAEGDKLFPYSLQASAVLDALRYECETLGITIICDCYVKEITPDLKVITDSNSICAKAVIVACGGNAAPKSGSDGNGVKLLCNLGHSKCKTVPSIVPIRTELAPIKPLKGVKVDSLFKLDNGAEALCERGEVLFTEYGLSGPAVMQISRMVAISKKSDIIATVDFLPDMEYNKVVDYLCDRKDKAYGDIAENLTLGLLNKRVGQAVIKYCGLNVNDKCSDYSIKTLKAIANAIKCFKVKVTDVCSFDSAQTTAGGVELNCFDSATLESKLVKGLYACGEILDCDGDCGGFNLHWAWLSGATAGVTAARRV